ncbi:peroxiredoxin family protein [Acidobacteria bacterium AH-259-O06]|nr:peroxiredoxin family protein [Acidobacteria bacterium AH-259-O06]
MLRTFGEVALLVCLTSGVFGSEEAIPGLSRLGEPFDEGPRLKPWRMEGLGKVDFPITTSDPDAQEWFNQGVALLHVYFYNEAERTFRWVLNLDPDCAMAYWGLSMSTYGKRARRFLDMALERKDKVSERERRWIEAWDARTVPDTPEELTQGIKTRPLREREFTRRLERLLLDYPDDVEFRVFYGHECYRRARRGRYSDDARAPDRLACETVLQQVLEANPDHPGAHHYRVHNWDGPDANVVADSARHLGKIATDSGHALHMPGHIFSGLGMWHEAAIAQDTANRTELAYQRKHNMLPSASWNYRHNRDYLCYVQEQLGMAEEALRGARELSGAAALYREAHSLQRALIKFERWEELLGGDAPPWGDEDLWERIHKTHGRTLAQLNLGDIKKAREEFENFRKLKDEVEKSSRIDQMLYNFQSLQLRARFALAQDEVHLGLRLLTEAAEEEAKFRERVNDPPKDQHFLYNALGWEYLARRSPELAARAFEKTLKTIRNDGFALAGLVEAYIGMEERDKAQNGYSRLLHVWSRADPGLKWLKRAKAAAEKAGLDPTPKDVSPATQRTYDPSKLASVGPNEWQPNPAPELEAIDSEGKSVALDDYRGKTLVLVFAVSADCESCLSGLAKLAEKTEELEKKKAVVLAVTPDKPELLAKVKAEHKLPFVLLSDPQWKSGRRFKSYDEFEEMRLNSTLLIDAEGGVHWAKYGGKPYEDINKLLEMIDRVNRYGQSRKEKSSMRTAVRGAARPTRQ